jgi:squalene-hopene/tetraprenyl-beta-curcumene cyclase
MSSWMHSGAMDHGTFCISCHTGLPFALARRSLNDAVRSSVEAEVLDSVEKRVSVWEQVQPYLGDKSNGLGTEAVINALTLSSRDAVVGKLSEPTRHALKIFWSTQIVSGPEAGAWPWVNFGNEPWEAPDSDYWGATLAAVAVGIAPEDYRDEPEIQHGLAQLEAYLNRPNPNRPLLDQLGLLWAGTKLPGLVSRAQKQALVASTLAAQNPDGGWSTASLLAPSWKRHDGTAQNMASDGYGTGAAAYILEQSGQAGSPVRKALRWLAANQDPSTGAWPAVSPNVTRDTKTDAGHFMTDASTAFAVLALTNRG